ncbi:MAG: hypothetical protein IJT65_03225 [Eubacterium sp.]|nr:hypothetical protein [Eubacterium sp.]
MHCFSLINEKQPPEQGAPRRKKAGLLVSLAAVVLIAVVVCSILIFNKNKNEEKPLNSSSVTTAQTQRISQTETNPVATEKPLSTTVSTTKERQSENEINQTQQTSEKTVKETEKSTVANPKTTKQASRKIVIKNGRLISYPAGLKNSSYTIPYDVKSIEKDAFKGNKYLKKIKFSKRETLNCDWNNLFRCLPNLDTIYIYAGTNADTEGMQYFSGEIVYYD